MSKQYRVIRKVATVPVVAGGLATIDLPRDFDYESVLLRIYGGLQVTVGATSVRAENPCQTVSRVDLIAEGKNLLKSAPFWYFSMGRYDRPLIQAGARVTTPASAVGVATYQVEAIAALDFMTPDSIRPKDSNFRSRGLSLFQVRLTFGQAGDNFVGGTENFSSMNVDIFVQQLVEETDDKGNFMTSPVMLRKTTWQRVNYTASNANAELRLPAGNLVRGTLFRAEGAVTAGEPSAAVLNNVILQNGMDTRINLAAANLRALNNANFGQFTAGYYAADLLDKGPGSANLTELWDVTGASEPKAFLDVTGGANVFVDAVTEEYVLASGV